MTETPPIIRIHLNEQQLPVVRSEISPVRTIQVLARVLTSMVNAMTDAPPKIAVSGN